MADVDPGLVELLVTSTAGESVVAAGRVLDCSSAQAGRKPTSWLPTAAPGPIVEIASSSRRVHSGRGPLSVFALQMASARQGRTALSGTSALKDCILPVETLTKLMMLL